MNPLLRTLTPRADHQICFDHSHVLVTFHRYDVDAPDTVKRGLVDMICTALEIHATLEEEIFYPAMREVQPDNEVLAKSVPEHDAMREAIASLRSMSPGDPAFDSTVFELMREVIHHVADEETVLLPEARRLLGQRLDNLGVQMARRRIALVGPRAGEIATSLGRATRPATWMLLAGAIGLGFLMNGRSRRV